MLCLLGRGQGQIGPQILLDVCLSSLLVLLILLEPLLSLEFLAVLDTGELYGPYLQEVDWHRDHCQDGRSDEDYFPSHGFCEHFRPHVNLHVAFRLSHFLELGDVVLVGLVIRVLAHSGILLEQLWVFHVLG